MKKVLVLTHEYFPFAGGVAMYCYNLFKNFPAENYLVASDCPELKNQNNNVKIKLVSSYLWPHWLPGLWAVVRLVRKNKIKVIFTPNILPLGSIAYIIKKIFGIPYVISLHGLDINLALQNKPTWTKKILQSAQAIVCNTQYTSGLIKDLVPVDKVSVIYPNISINSEKISAEQIKSIKEKYQVGSAKVILTVGRLVERKGHALVIEALKNLADLDCKYWIVGDGPNRANLEKQVMNNNLSDKVFFLGRVDTEQLPLFYQAADLFVMPNQELGSDVEGFGMVFLEAATFGLPIIAGFSGGVKEIFTGNGDVCYADNTQDIALAIRDLLTDEKKAASYGQQAYLISEKFKNKQAESIKLLEKILS
ncbi:MAG: glycosyltransferase family 4 protein [Patescibacteria group bacterium]|jgi:phosphatidylinositol alpha-1,6-mannosyltransferase